MHLNIIREPSDQQNNQCYNEEAHGRVLSRKEKKEDMWPFFIISFLGTIMNHKAHLCPWVAQK